MSRKEKQSGEFNQGFLGKFSKPAFQRRPIFGTIQDERGNIPYFENQFFRTKNQIKLFIFFHKKRITISTFRSKNAFNASFSTKNKS